MLVHIIHPYVYRAGDPSKSAPAERNGLGSSVRGFLRACLDKEVDMLRHNMYHDRDLDEQIKALHLESDHHLALAYDPRVREITTSRGGLPLSDQRPSEDAGRSWDFLVGKVTGERAFREAVGNPNLQMFIGGELEMCLGTVAGYVKTRCTPESEVFYVPDLCVSFFEKRASAMLRNFRHWDIKPLSYGQAVALLG